MRAALLVLVALLAPAVAAQPTTGSPQAIDATITITKGSAPLVDAPAGWARPENHTDGERYEWNLTLPRDYQTFEVRALGLGLTSPKQLLPLLRIHRTEPICQDPKTVGFCDFPLFEPFPNDRIWDVDGPARVYFANGTGNDLVLRLGIPGPVNATLVLQRDATPPGYELGPVENLTYVNFYRETHTDELAVADLQIRKAGAAEWIQNPTQVFHFRQRFPVQGLDAETSYEMQVVFTDWSGNQATSPIETLRTPPEPVRPLPTVLALDPSPNATLPRDAPVVVRARILSNESPVAASDVRLFFDKREVPENLTFAEGVLTYAPGPLAGGHHSVSVEATNQAGGKGVARWTFDVESPAPGAPAVAALAAAAVLALAMRRRPG